MAGESRIRHTVARYAKLLGWTHYGFVSPGKRGVPDDVFTKAVRRVVLIEFKDYGKTSTTQQLKRQDELRAQGFDVFECDSVELGRAIFNSLTR